MFLCLCFSISSRIEPICALPSSMEFEIVFRRILHCSITVSRPISNIEVNRQLILLSGFRAYALI